MFSVRIFQKEGGSGAFFLFFLEFTATAFFENIKNNIGPHHRIPNFQTELSLKVCCPLTTERAYQGFITLYIDLAETQIHSQIKTTMAKQLHCFEKDRKASRLKHLRNRYDQKKCTVIIFIYSFRT